MAITRTDATVGGYPNDLISREDALKPFCTAPDGTRIPEVDCDNFHVEFSVEFIKKHLLSLPSADRQYGEWIDVSDCYEPNEKCSVCGEVVHEYNYNYCPNCGIRMKGAEHEID